MDKWERKHRLYMQRLERMIKAIYETAAREAASISSAVGDIGDDLFNFDRYPITKARVDELFNTMQQNMEVAIVDGINAQWALANEKNDDLCTRILGNTYDNLTPQQRQRYFTNNEGARLAFLARKNKGLSLSDQVWRYTNAYRQEIEMGLDMGIRDGLSADELSRELRSYLKYPDKLFRRVRNEHGQLVLSKAAQAFHPGRGVYRSSYMNARRLAATETNIAYRTADYERYNRLDFVVGIEVHLSDTNHNCKGVPAGSFVDICDTLAGKYPKQFKFVGWHPHCRCYVTSILKTDQEIAADNERILRGEEPLVGSVNSVEQLPQNFTKWAKAHKDIKGSPYWLKDNFNNGKFSDGVVWENKSSDNKPLSVAEQAAIRHSKRTPEQIASIKQRWEDRVIYQAYQKLSLQDDNDALSNAIFYYGFIGNSSSIVINNTFREYALEKDATKKESILLQLKSKCAAKTAWELRRAGIANGFEYKGLKPDYIIYREHDIIYNGQQIHINKYKTDLIELKGRSGKSYFYEIGTPISKVNFKMNEVEDFVSHSPIWVRDNFDALISCNQTHPLDSYFKVAYNGFTRGGMYSGDTITVHDKYYGNSIDNIVHEIGHNIDKNKIHISNNPIWKNAVIADNCFPTEYAKTNLKEDWAESLWLYVHNYDLMKKNMINRFVVIEAVIQNL